MAAAAFIPGRWTRTGLPRRLYVPVLDEPQIRPCAVAPDDPDLPACDRQRDGSSEACERLFSLHSIESDEERARLNRYQAAVASGDAVAMREAYLMGMIGYSVG